MRRPRPRYALDALIVAAVVVGAALATVVGVVYAPATDAGPPDFWGYEVIVDEASSPALLDAASGGVRIRMGCKIGVFGVAPWRPQSAARDHLWEHKTRLAFGTMGLPPEAAAMAVRRIQHGQPDGAIAMSNTHGTAVVGEAGLYLPVFHTTSSTGDLHASCIGSTTNFGNDHRSEHATVYRVRHEGVTYHVGEILVCGNVTRFFPAPPGWMPYAAAPALAHGAPAPAAGARGAITVLPQPAVLEQSAKPIPEPSTLALIGVAVAGFIATTRRKSS